MSRGYWVRVPTVISQIIARAEDSVELGVSLLPILPPKAMDALLEEALIERGWTKQKDGALTQQVGDVEMRLEGDSITLTIRREAAVTGRGTNKAQAEAQAASRVADKEAQLRDRLGEALLRAERALRDEMEVALQEIYARALKQRAAEIGEITSIQEREVDGEIELTIKVEV